MLASLAAFRNEAFSSELRRNFSVASFGIGLLAPQFNFVSSPLTLWVQRGYIKHLQPWEYPHAPFQESSLHRDHRLRSRVADLPRLASNGRFIGQRISYVAGQNVRRYRFRRHGLSSPRRSRFLRG